MAQPSTNYKIPRKNKKNENSDLLDKEEELLRELDLDDGNVKELKEKIKILEQQLKEKEKMEIEKEGKEGEEETKGKLKEEEEKKPPRWKRGGRGRKREYRGRGNRGRKYAYYKRGGNFIFNNYS